MTGSKLIKLRRDYNNQRSSAKKRGIDFLLSFDEWLAIWQASSKLHKRGRAADQYCMCRVGDAGPYSKGNVKIATMLENFKENWVTNGSTMRAKMSAARIGKPAPNKGMRHTIKTRLKMSKSHSGKRRPENAERARQLGYANQGRKHTKQARVNMGSSRLGAKHSQETKLKMSLSRKAYWERRRQDETK